MLKRLRSERENIKIVKIWKKGKADRWKFAETTEECRRLCKKKEEKKQKEMKKEIISIKAKGEA